MEKYNQFINDIITQYGQHRKNLPNPNGIIYERHHIVPRCVGGSDNLFNLGDLTPREHYIAHKLLAEALPHEEKIVCAWHFMSCINKKLYCPTPEEYEASRYAIIRTQGRPVYQLTKDGQIVNLFISAREAARSLNTVPAHIIECCNKSRSQSNGYCWQYVQDYEEKGFDCLPPKKEYTRSVKQYTLDGKYVQTFDKITRAAEAVGGHRQSIAKCCQGKLNSSAGYKWSYVDEDKPRR